VNTCESHASHQRRVALAASRHLKRSPHKYLRAFQLRRELYRKPGRKALKRTVKAALSNQQCAIQER
jgi:transposase-like protein